MISEKIIDHLIFFPKDNIIIFPINNYIPIIANTIINDYDEWGLLENKIITQKEKYFKFFLKNKLDKLINSFKILFRDYNIKIYTVYNKNYNILSIHKKYIENTDKFFLNIIKNLKNKTKYISEIDDTYTFEVSEDTFRGIKIGKYSGEIVEFLLSLNKF